jgi:hypothetical protein
MKWARPMFPCDRRGLPFVATASMKLTLAAKIDAILKRSIVASVLLASSGPGYYYLVYLPQRDVQFQPQRYWKDFEPLRKSVLSRSCCFSNKRCRNSKRRNKKP